MMIINNINLKNIFDISVSLSSKTPVFPGQSRFKREYISSISRGDRANVSQFSMTTHTGTHVDAPLHFIKDGITIDKVDFCHIVGLAKVFELDVDEIDAKDLESLDIEKNDIVLFKTKNSEYWDIEDFNYNYTYIKPEAAEYLKNKQVSAVGIDYIIPEKFEDVQRPVHHILLGNNINLIEGLNFKNVPEGNYLLVCLPLKIENGDAAPARAILIEVEEG